MDKRYVKPAIRKPENGIGGHRTYSIGKPLSKRYPGSSGEYECEVDKTSQFVNAGGKVVFLEETDGDGFNDRTWNMSLDSSDPRWVDPFAILHNGSSTFAFADGHCDKHKWVEKATIELAETQEKGESATNADGSVSQDWIWFKRAYIPGRRPSGW